MPAAPPDPPAGDGAAAALLAALGAARGRAAEALVLEAERILTPGEFLDLVATLARTGHPAHALLAARRAEGDLAASRRPPEPFVRTPLGEDALFFRGPGPVAGKTLVIGFAGLRGRLGIPTACLLQRLDARRHDLLLLHDGARAQFRQGCRGLARDFPGLVAAVAARAGAPAYGRRIAIGYSIGALPAAQFAVLAGAERAVAVSARPRDDALRLLRGEAVPTAFDPLCACLARGQREILFVHAERHDVDRAAARALAGAGGGVSVAVLGLGNHGVVDTLWVRGSLERVLAFALHGRMPARPGGQAGFDPGRPGRRGWRGRLRAALGRLVAAFRRRGRPAPGAPGPKGPPETL
ncbi:MAG: hypothetical protein IT545_09595 [Rhodobacteraceae bacterium]|nr:hypothetical protein [Paracoccaceae bacterium]